MILPQLLANGIVTGSIYALVALGFALIYNTTRVFHLAHGGIYTAAAYALFFLSITLKIPILPAFALSLALPIALGIFIEVVIYAPLNRREGSLLVCLLSSLGFYIVIVNIIALLFGNETKVLRPGAEKTYTFASIILTKIQLLSLFVSLIVVTGILLLLRHTRMGKSIRAVRDHPTLARVIGIDTGKIRIQVFILGSMLAGIGAMLTALDVGIDPNIGMPAFLAAAVAVIIGGIGIFEGAILGAFLLGVLQSLIIWKLSARWVEGATFLVLILFLIFRPGGILGQKKRIEEIASE